MVVSLQGNYKPASAAGVAVLRWLFLFGAFFGMLLND
jgi:hypothetical protein